MPKILKPYTIIPPDLYVKRDADRQIRNIIKDMGRPGYVLVSRQMGKTNLLLNAKRELQNEMDFFVYIDLSTHFDTAKSCFENIIDLIIETNEDRLGYLFEGIIEKRKHYIDTPPHKQHINELRTILKSFEGKLIIILDEIDALTKTNYSDQIFSQIRSIYFTRVNFPELNRLTYILSGVIEPSEIIKDPKISPFNIGQKIFLNDFSKDEFDQFVIMSQLNLDMEVSNRIFFWTNGNPRITWDLCSEVENKLKENSVINSEQIDIIVKEMYLTTYDKPPVDNIRELVRKDREIRNAIVEIGYKKGNEISQRIKNKLYLSGIINYEQNSISIKNEIIRQSLSNSWIQSIEADERGLVKIAMDFFENGKFEEALSVFKQFLDSNEFDPSEKSLCFYYMGYAAYINSDFDTAITYLKQATFDFEDEPKMYYRLLNLKGLANYYAGNFEDSLAFFKEVMNSGKRDEEYAKALINFGTISLNSNKSFYKEEAVQIFNDIISEKAFDNKKLNEKLISELKSIAHFNLANLYVSLDNKDLAKANFLNAQKLAKLNIIPRILIQLESISDDALERDEILQKLVELIIEDKVSPIKDDPDRPLDFNFHDLKDVLVKTYLHEPQDLFNRLSDKLIILGEQPLADHILDLALHVIEKNRDLELAVKVLSKLYNHRANHNYGFTTPTLNRMLKLLAVWADVASVPEIFIEYIHSFENDTNKSIDYSDLNIFISLIFYYYKLGQYQSALTYINIAELIKPKVSQDILSNYLIIYNIEAQIHLNLRDNKNAKEAAIKIIELTSNESIMQQKSKLLGDTGFEIIRGNAQFILNSEQRNYSIKTERKIGRNDIIKVRYNDGSIIEIKYKRVEEDIRKGECIILE